VTLQSDHLMTQIVARNKTGESLGLHRTNKFGYYSLSTRPEADKNMQETDKAVGKELKDKNSHKIMDITLHRGAVNSTV